jgi:hypothetical protein
VGSLLDIPDITPWPMNSGRWDNFSGSPFTVDESAIDFP